MTELWQKIRMVRRSVVAGALCGLLLLLVGAYTWYLSDRIAPRTYLGQVAVGGLTQQQAVTRLQEAFDRLQSRGIRLNISGTMDIIHPDAVGFDLNLSQAIDAAFAHGHDGAGLSNAVQLMASLWGNTVIDAPVHVNQSDLAAQLDQVAAAHEVPRQDVRLAVIGTTVRLLTDTKPGQIIDRDQAMQLIMRSLVSLSDEPIILDLKDDQPRAALAGANRAVGDAQKMISRPLSLAYEDAQFFVSRQRLGSWIKSEYDGPQLKAGLDTQAIAQYVTGIATSLNVGPEPPHISTQEGRVTGFEPPKVGRAVQEDQLVGMIITALSSRADKDKLGDSITIPTKTTKLALTGLDSGVGITELIGKAVTPFTGSPKNRISNIKNGVKFISGTIIPPGEEFSALKTLGTVDNTSGYLPELVIKGDRTAPEFGGGLCQVSTTLFRAVLDAGLPVTARRNHSYRVSYYEKDGTGKVIGPGLDATIYEPNPDLRFRNDTATPVLIVGYVIGDKVTFELYGTKDGRSSAIDGPHLLTETPPGETKYIQTDALPLGMKKQVETPHSGGSATATYRITYPDGRVTSKEFKSYYRPWPAQYLIGTNPNCSTAAQCAAIMATLPSPSPTP